MNETNLNVVAETEPGYGQLFAVLVRRRFWLLGVLCATLSIATVRTLTTKPTYESSMQLLVESNYQGKKEGLEAESEYTDSNVEIDNATQLNIMRSSQLLQNAVDLLRVKYPDINIDEIKDSLVVTQVVEEEVYTKIFQIVYTGNDPIKTQEVLEAIRKVYQNYNREQQKLRLTKGLAFIDTQLPKVRGNLIQSEAALERFRKNQNLIEPELQAKALSDALSAIDQERQTLRAQYEDFQARYTSLQQQLAGSPRSALIPARLSQSSRYQGLLNEIQKTELGLAQQRVRYKDSSPQVQDLLQQRQQQLALLQKEAGRVLGSPTQANGTGEGFLAKGQLGEVDLNLTSQLVDAKTNLVGLMAREQTLAQKQQQLRAELNLFPRLLSEYNRLQPNVQLNRDTLQQLEKARQELSLEIARGGFDWQVVEEPQPGVKTGPSLKQNLLLGVVAGLMLGGVTAFIRETVDDAVHSCDDLKKQIALPLLGITPKLPPAKIQQPIVKLPFGKPQLLEPWTIEVINWSPYWESLDLIYLNIQLLNKSAYPFKSLVVTSSVAGEGKSTLALGLAMSAARLHQRVLLIDADLRNPHLHKLLNLPNEQGLSTLLTTDATTPSKSSIQSSSSYINVLTSGPTPTDPANLLSSPSIGQLIAAFEQTYDLVVVDTPPVLGMVDAILTASYCSGVVLVARIDQVTRTELTQATAMLSKLKVIGVIANGASGSTNNYIPKT